ncbi:SWIM zinc finger family protein [Nocardioides sp.]|uniref:SWIM zinc finger family protein n=1 Tax=Nocardioides sp. TaxID=35761 RepID=UPI002B277D80|nr:SWIM zinc finger family protein [Nocardioides sp.]
MSAQSRSEVIAHPPLAARRGAARATTWWGKAWVRAVEESAYADDELRAARALARQGAVGGISLGRGRLVAAVADSRGLWSVAVALPTVDSEAGEALVEVVAAEAGRIGALLAGDLPHTLVEHADEAGVELLPFGGELECSCSCDAWVDPCPHALAVLYQAAWLLDRSPLLLLHLRGLPREELLARLHALTTRAVAPTSLPTSAPSEDNQVDADVDVALDAADRAAQLLSRLDAGGSIDHLL